ncbi:MAG: COX15/CtaA family protein [candidate division NC10 bacterium]|nr:COX15/CtaA family protein [candidate division NC10 bacterium]
MADLPAPGCGPALLGLHGFAVLTAGGTLALIFVGGLVTSTGSGLAVPDWPLAFGRLFPPMVGGVLYEHGHRLAAAAVGLLTIVLAGWLWAREPRAWVRGLGVAALLAILLQGLLGGLTVLYLLPTAVSVAHALLAQAFFGLTVTLAVVTGPGWAADRAPAAGRPGPGLPALGVATVAAVLGQLFLGALMRHTGAGLAIPDFPLAFGRLVPPLDAEPVRIHFLHRVGAVVVAAGVGGMLGWVLFRHRREAWLTRPALAAAALTLAQILLGALIIWTHRGVLVTTAHVATGAALLAAVLTLTLRAFRLSAGAEAVAGRSFVHRRVAA